MAEPEFNSVNQQPASPPSSEGGTAVTPAGQKKVNLFSGGKFVESGRVLPWLVLAAVLGTLTWVVMDAWSLTWQEVERSQTVSGIIKQKSKTQSRTVSVNPSSVIDQTGGTFTTAEGSSITIAAGVLPVSVRFSLLTNVERGRLPSLLPRTFPMPANVTICAEEIVGVPENIDEAPVEFTAIVTVPLTSTLRPGTSLIVLEPNPPDNWADTDEIATVGMDGRTASFKIDNTGTYLLALRESKGFESFDYEPQANIVPNCGNWDSLRIQIR